MAASLDVNILSNKILDVNIIEKIINDYQVAIGSISSIDNWRWDNEQQVEINQLMKLIEAYKIIIIKLISPLLKDSGVYIEKINEVYLYTLWINTDGYSCLDCDMITLRNRTFYEKVCKAILKIDGDNQNLFEMVGIGVETDFCYSENIMDIVQNSRNMIVWILPSNINLNGILRSYKKKNIEGFNKTLFERIR